MPFRWPSMSAPREAATWVRPCRRMARWCTPGRLPGGTQLTWFDRAGRALGTLGEAAPYARPRAVTRRTPRCGRAGNREPGKPRHLDHRHRPQLTVPPDGRSGTRCVAGVVARRHAHRVRRPAIAEGVLASEVDQRNAADESLLEGSGFITPSGWSTDGRFIAYTLQGRFRGHPTSGSFRCSAIANRFRWQKPRSPRPQQRSLRMDDGSRTRPTKAASPTSTFNRFSGPARSIQCRGTEEAILSGERTARNCSTSERTGR